MKPRKRLSLNLLLIGSLILSVGLLNNFEILSTAFGSNVPVNTSPSNETNQTLKINQDLPAKDQIKSNSSENEVGFVMNINESMSFSGPYSSSSSPSPHSSSSSASSSASSELSSTQSSGQLTSDQIQDDELTNDDKNSTYQRGKYLVDDNGIHYYNINNCSEKKGSSGIGNLSECEDAERELREES